MTDTATIEPTTGKSAQERGVPEGGGYDFGREVADRNWADAEVFAMLGGPSDRDRSADEMLNEARNELGIDVSDDEARGFTDRWNELKGGAEPKYDLADALGMGDADLEDDGDFLDDEDDDEDAE